MIIAQITDLHVVARDRLCYRRVPTNEQLAQAIAHINDLDPAPDVVIASGDLTDHGRPEEYEVLSEILSKLKAPIFVIPGNHDRRDALSQAFADQCYMPQPDTAFINYAVEDFPLRLIGLDTTVPDHHHGLMCEDRLRWLDDTLRARPDSPTFIFMHHPPFRTGIQWMDAAGLHGGRKMEEIVARHPQVVRVACGHIHRPIHLAWAGTIASTSPSTCHQVSLTLTGRGGFDFVMEPRAIQLHAWDPCYGLVSHTSYVPNGYEHMDMLASLEEDARRKMLSDSRSVYEEMCAEEFERR
ncbi:MAG: phosphodiesterase [Candidatus Binataceae bacterium]